MAGARWLDLPAVRDVCDLTYKMWQKGWDEAYGGNVTYLLTPEEASALGYVPGTGRAARLTEGIPEGVRGRYVLVTATGSYFREIKDDPEHLLGIVYLPREGSEYEVVAGLAGNRPTSELASHLMTHAVRLAADPAQRVVMHNHATHVLAMTHCGPTDEREFTLALWRMITEGIMVFPDGVGLVPWCTCGTPKIAYETNEKMRTRRVVVWQYHGVFTTGDSMREAFGLLETVDKCCEAWLLAEACGHRNPGISDQGLREVAAWFNVTPRPGYLD